MASHLLHMEDSCAITKETTPKASRNKAPTVVSLHPVLLLFLSSFVSFYFGVITETPEIEKALVQSYVCSFTPTFLKVTSCVTVKQHQTGREQVDVDFLYLQLFRCHHFM